MGTHLHWMHAPPLGNVPVFSSSENLTLREDLPVRPSQICHSQSLAGLELTMPLVWKLDVQPNHEHSFERGGY